MKDILELIIKNLVEKKDEVLISESLEKDVTVFSVKVNSADMGRVIGKEGKIAKSIRILMKSIANADRKKVTIHFID